ncbi:carbon-nitrogen hydrolase family protein [Arboricoccus pini]|nr:carbon-nitrogen hydrolase family protein [Arboricoccus pini]
MLVAALQPKGCMEDLAVNEAAVCAALAAAAAASVKLAVLPELAMLPYFCAEPAGSRCDWAVSIDADVLARVAAHCASLGIAALLPFYEWDPDGPGYNSAVLIGADGRLVPGAGLQGSGRVARKLHLPSGPDADEAGHFRPGADLRVFDLGGLRLGCLICYDRRFPEAWRALRALGADLVAVPVAGLSGEDDAFVLGELRTHARENGLAVIYASRAGEDRLAGTSIPQPGGSCVIAADGTVLARSAVGAAATAGMAVAAIERADIERARATLPLFERRHPILTQGFITPGIRIEA